MSDIASGKERRKPKPATQERLRKAALFYIDRYATSGEHLKSVLMRRVIHSARLHDTDQQEGRIWIDEIVADLVNRRLIDDRAFAETRTISLHRGGASRRKISMSLKMKGIGPDDIEAALRALDENHDNAELVAARNYARRRRFGPWRNGEERTDRRDRDLAAMARAGFSFRMAQRVIDAADIDALDQDVANPDY
ncbi:MAG: RecX family transcriptional regulator [Alphaproteobacteria bacterium]|nr:RecX family transcriptional regulator [Alphaproteobacteria bacterium]